MGSMLPFIEFLLITIISDKNCFLEICYNPKEFLEPDQRLLIVSKDFSNVRIPRVVCRYDYNSRREKTQGEDPIPALKKTVPDPSLLQTI